MPRYLIAIDLHGTLLDGQWEIKPGIRKELVANLQAVRDFCKVYVCSGNDLTFIEDHVPPELRECFDGYILETGCVISDGTDEKTIVPEHMINDIKCLEARLKESKPSHVKYFARRLATISMFTTDASGGVDPDMIYPGIRDLVREFGYDERVLVTHSSVAVDIIPRGYNKFSGIEHLSDGLQTIGIADSLNDYHMILHADHSFVPANSSPKLIDKLKGNGKVAAPIRGAEAHPENTVLMSRYDSTRGVIDILDFINNNLR